MRKNYIVPQVEAIQLSCEEIMDTIGIIRHSGGTNSGQQGGFTDENQIG